MPEQNLTAIHWFTAENAVEISYCRLEELTGGLGRHLEGSDGGHVALIGDSCVETVLAVLACIRAARPFCILTPSTPVGRAVRLLDDTKAQVVVLCGVGDSKWARTGHSCLLGRNVISLDCSSFLGGPGETRSWISGGDYAEIEASSGPSRDIEGTPFGLVEWVRGREAEHMYSAFTSGTTSRPRMIRVPVRAMLAFCDGWECLVNLRGQYRAGSGPASRVLVTSGSTWDPFLVDVISTIRAGATLCLLPPDTLLHSAQNAIPRVSPTHMLTSPALLRMATTSQGGDESIGGGWLEQWRQSGEMRLECLCVGGEACPISILEAWEAPGVRVLNVFGVTECVGYQLAYHVTRNAIREVSASGHRVMNRIGQPFGSNEAYVTEDGSIETTKKGELVIVGGQVADGYDGGEGGGYTSWKGGMRAYRTGDVVWLDEACDCYVYDGRLRVGEQVKINSQRVDLAEIDATIVESPLVSAAAASTTDLGSGSDGKRSNVSAIVVARADILDSISEVRRSEVEDLVADCATLRCEHFLQQYMVPRLVVTSNSIPLTTGGKVDRRAVSVSAQHIAEARERNSGLRQLTDLEQAIAKVWMEFLKLDTIKPRDNFFRCGGDSLVSLRTVMRLRTELTGEWYLGHDARDAKDAFGAANLIARPTLEEYAAFLKESVPNLPFSNVVEEPKGALHMTSQGSCTEGAFRRPASLGEDALRRAALLGVAEAVGELLGLGVDVEGGLSRKKPGTTPLHLAAKEGHYGAVKLLLENGAKPNFGNGTGATPLHLSLTNPAFGWKVAELLVSHGAATGARDKPRLTALHYAARTGNSEAVDAIAKLNPSLMDKIDKWTRFPLHWAVLNGHVECARALFRNGASVRNKLVRPGLHNRRTHAIQESQLHIAVSLAGHNDALATEMTELLLENGADPLSCTDSDGLSVMERLQKVSGGNPPPELVQMLEDAAKRSPHLTKKRPLEDGPCYKRDDAMD